VDPLAPLTSGPGIPLRQQRAQETTHLDPYKFFKEFIVKYEGSRYVRDSNGAGVKYGINEAYNPGVDVKNLSMQGAAEIFKKKYFEKSGADKLPAEIAAIYADMFYLNEKKARALLKASGGDPKIFMDMRDRFLTSLVQGDPGKYGKYKNGWQNRSNSLRQYARGAGGGQGGQGFSAIPYDAGDPIGPDGAVTPIQTAMREITEADKKFFERQQQAFKNMAAALKQESENFEAWLAANPAARTALGLKGVADAYAEAYDKFQGQAVMAQSEQYGRQAGRADAFVRASDMGVRFGGDPETASMNRQMAVQAQVLGLRRDEFALVNETRRATQGQIAEQMALADQEKVKNGETEKYLGFIANVNRLVAEQAQIEAIITEEYARRALIAADPNNAATVRGNIAKYMQNNEAENNIAGMPEGIDPLDGLRQGVMKFAAEVPTVFETMRDAASTALSGIADIGANILTGTEQNIRQAVAGMLRAIAQMIARMVIMMAVVAGLKAMGFPVELLGLAGGVGVPVKKNAKGGTSKDPANDMLRLYAKGGVARQPQIAMFGEGRTPEAYIPMEDHRSIPVRMDDEGNMFVPLPSGQIIPVNFAASKKPKRFASGGIGSYSPSRAMMADTVSSGGSEAVSRSRGRTANDNPTSVTNTIMVPVTINGNASGDDADRISQEVGKRIDAILKEREAENSRQYARRGNSIASEYGVR
jgi:hypothetical protein